MCVCVCVCVCVCECLCVLNAALLLFNDTPTPFFIMIFHNNVQPGMLWWMTLKYNLPNGCFVYLSCWGVHRASYCNCMETDRSQSERSQFIFSFLLCIIHYLRAVLIQGRYSEIGSCLGVVPNWTAEQLQTITPANHELVIIQKLRCKVGSSFESQLIKWDFAFMLYILSMWTCAETEGKMIFLYSGGLRALVCRALWV